MTNRPWMKVYPQRLRGNAVLRGRSSLVRCIFYDLMFIMHDCNPYGTLQTNGVMQSLDELSRAIGEPPETIASAIEELVRVGLFKKSRTGVVSCPAMIEDHAASIKGSQSAQKRWGPVDNKTAAKSARNSVETVKSEAVQVNERKRQSRLPNGVGNGKPTAYMQEARSNIDNNIDPTLIPRDATPDGDPPLAFPATGSIAYIEPWRSIAKASGKNIDVDLFAESFRDWLMKKNIPFDAPKIRQIFTGFVANHRA